MHNLIKGKLECIFVDLNNLNRDIELFKNEEFKDIVEEEKTPDVYFVENFIIFDLNFLANRIIAAGSKNKFLLVYQEENNFVRSIINEIKQNKKIKNVFDIFIEVLWMQVDRINDFLDKMQKKVKEYNRNLYRQLHNINPKVLFKIHTDIINLLDLKHDLSYFIKMLNRKRVVDLFNKDKKEFEEVINDFREVLSFTEMTIDMVKSFLDTYDALAYREMNFLIKRLTSLDIILMVLAMIPAIYGMNIALPLSKSGNAFTYLISLMILLFVVLLIVFRKIRWL